jgi:hypothetical protein
MVFILEKKKQSVKRFLVPRVAGGISVMIWNGRIGCTVKGNAAIEFL